MADHLPAHVAHVHRRNESLETKIRRLKERGAKVAQHSVRTIEVAAGALAGGVLQGMAKDPTKGATIFHLPADLTIAAGLKLAGILELAGAEYSDHLNNLGDGFLGAAVSDIGHALGAKRQATGSFFGHKASLPPGPPPSLPAMAPPAAVAASGDPQAMAAQLLAQMQGR